MSYSRNASSMELLKESLAEIKKLSKKARVKNPILHEGLELTPFQTILFESQYILEQENGEDKEGFLSRTAAAIKKLSAAADKAVSEIDAYLVKLPPTFVNVRAALEAAKKEILDAKPGEGFLSKIGAGASAAIRGLFGKQDDPVEKVTELVTDANLFKTIVSKALETIKTSLGDMELTEEEQAALQEKTFGEIVNDPDLNEKGMPDEKAFQKAVATTFKTPKGMFGGWSKLGGALGMTLGGDLPLADHIDKDQFFEDLMGTQVGEFSAAAEETKEDQGADPAIEQMAEPLQAIQKQKEANPEMVQQLASGEGGAAPGGEPGGAGVKQVGKKWADVSAAVLDGVEDKDSTKEVLTVLAGTDNFKSSLKDLVVFAEGYYRLMHKRNLSSLLFEAETMSFEDLTNLGRIDKLGDEVDGQKVFVDIATALNKEIGEKVVTDIPTPEEGEGEGEGEGEVEGEGEGRETSEEIIAAIRQEFDELKKELQKMVDSGVASQEEVDKLVDAAGTEVDISPEDMDAALADDEEEQEDAAEDISKEEDGESGLEKVVDFIKTAVETGVDIVDATTSLEKSDEPDSDAIKALAKDLYKPGEVKKLDPAPRKHGKNNVSFAAKPKSGGKVRYFAKKDSAEKYAMREAILFLYKQGMNLNEIRELSSAKLFKTYFNYGGTKQRLVESVSRQILSEQREMGLDSSAPPELDWEEEDFVEEELDPSEEAIIAQQAQEILDQVGHGTISKRDLAYILKAFPDIVGAGYKATRARRAFRKAINQAMGTVVFEESFDSSFLNDNLLVEKILDIEVNEDVLRWRKLAGLND